jgi:carboxylate-amine ligase
MRISDAQPLQEDAISLAALTYALTARVARAIDDGEPAFLPTNREIEENFWRAIRWGLSGEFINLRTYELRPTRAAIEELIDWVQPVVAELGIAEYLTVPAANAAERQIARDKEGASLREIYAEQVQPKEAVSG